MIQQFDSLKDLIVYMERLNEMRYIREEWITKKMVTEMIRDLFYSFTVGSYERGFTILERYDSTNEKYSMKVYRKLKGDLDSLLRDFEDEDI